ncbi:MAG: hypothetical protein ACI9JM_000184 [Halioglobus sp.]|jgi:hypothetical protein
MDANCTHLNPFLSLAQGAAMLKIAEAFGSFGTYADEASSESLGEQLPQRFDAGINYFNSGLDGSGNKDDDKTAASRTNYFRETYAYGADIRADGIQAFLEHLPLAETARQLSGCNNIVPAIVYANLLVPGQELAIHTDVPEFRGANRKLYPQWLLVCMLHSGLFDAWRIPIQTCVSWFGDATGGAFTFYPEGASAARQSIPVTHNTAIMLDTDKVFHGVERVQQVLPDLPTIGRETRLHFCGDGQWELREGDAVLAQYNWGQLRYSISWKAYCFEDEAKEALWHEGSDDLTLEMILSTLEGELRERGALSGDRPDPTSFALLLVEQFIHFPSAAAA